MNDKVKGIVLSIQDYKENDVLMQVISEEYGVLSIVGKAAKKINSKNHFLPLCLYEFLIDYKDGKTIYSTHGYKLLESYFEDSDIEMMSFKNMLAELTLKNKDINCFDRLRFVYQNVNRENQFLLGCLYVSFLIKEFGISPVVDSCALCDVKKVVALSNRHGGFLCMNHLLGEEILSVDRLKKFRLVVKGGFENYDVLKEFKYELADLILFMDFYLENTDTNLKSYNFYRSIF